MIRKTLIFICLIIAIIFVACTGKDIRPGTDIQGGTNAVLIPTEQQTSRPTAAPSAKDGSGKQNGRFKTVVRKVTDGDTLEVGDGELSYKVRLIGIDTPETVKPGTPVQPYGKEASDYTKKMLEGKTVYLEKDVSETDQYGRLLRYLYLEDGTLFNELLVKEGYARVATFPPDVKYQDKLLQAERYARDNNKGLWAKTTSNSAPTPTQQGSTTGSGSPKQYVDSNGKGLIKGNINSNHEKIYHLPGQQFYDATKPEQWFKTEEEAVAAGFRKSQR